MPPPLHIRPKSAAAAAERGWAPLLDCLNERVVLRRPMHHWLHGSWGSDLSSTSASVHLRSHSASTKKNVAIANRRGYVSNFRGERINLFLNPPHHPTRHNTQKKQRETGVMVSGQFQKERKKNTLFAEKRDIERPISHTLIYLFPRATCQLKTCAPRKRVHGTGVCVLARV